MDLPGKKNAQVYLLFAIARMSGLIVGFWVVDHRTIEVMQAWMDEIKTQVQLTGLVYTDGFDPYKYLDYGTARHQVGKGKSQTYTIEGFHANTRHYLARLRRKTRECLHK